MAKVPCTKHRACAQKLNHICTSLYDFMEVVIFDTSFTDEVDKSDRVAAEWRRHHARSTAPAHKSEATFVAVYTIL